MDLSDLTQDVQDTPAPNLDKLTPNPKYYPSLVMRLEVLHLWACLLFLNSLIYQMTVIPVRLVTAFVVYLKSQRQQKFTIRTQLDLSRTCICLLTTAMLWHYTNSSTIYHWIRGQGNFKLYLLKALFSVADFLFRATGIANYTFYCSEFHQPRSRRKIYVTLWLTIIVSFHSFCLLMEMFVIHVALTMSTDSCFVYVLIDCFKELTLQVFKKADYIFLFNCALDDSVERFQIYFYIMSTLMQTRQDLYLTMKHVGILLAGEMIVDYVKHYFLVRLNKVNGDFYQSAQDSLLLSYHTLH